jgi:anti-anti-sigma factor
MILVNETPATLTIAVRGAATMTESPAVHTTATEKLTHGVDSIRFDLRDCSAMDSTFSGTLLSLKRQLGEQGGTLTLVSPSDRVVELLREMGLEDFYAIEYTPPSTAAFEELRPAPLAAEALRNRILDAHEELARAPGPARKFGQVVEELRKDSSAPSSRSKDDGRPSSTPHLN